MWWGKSRQRIGIYLGSLSFLVPETWSWYEAERRVDGRLWVVFPPVESARNDAGSASPTDPKWHPFCVSPLIQKTAHLFDPPSHSQRILFLGPHRPLQSDYGEVTTGHWANFKLWASRRLRWSFYVFLPGGAGGHCAPNHIRTKSSAILPQKKSRLLHTNGGVGNESQIQPKCPVTKLMNQLIAPQAFQRNMTTKLNLSLVAF